MTTAFFRTVILYFILMVGLRLMGKRQIGELEPSELVLTLIISDLAAVPMQDFGIPLVNGLFPIVTLLCLSMLLSFFSLKSIRFRSLVCGRPTLIIREGSILQQNMARNRFTVDELLEQLRCQGYSDLAAVKYAILETNGQLTVLLKAAEMPLTAAQAGLKPQEKGIPTLIISDGRLLARNLKGRGLDDVWLDKQLKHYHVKHIKEVFALSVDEGGSVYFAKKEGKR